LITVVAGFLDAVGFTQLNHLYVSLMSGNSTHFGMSLAAGAWSDVIAAAGTVIAAFVMGAFAGTFFPDLAGDLRVSAILIAELLLLFAVAGAVLGCSRIALIVVAAAWVCRTPNIKSSKAQTWARASSRARSSVLDRH
jgi:uncharacterized membrane protein YoaK (UPF0700 family)